MSKRNTIIAVLVVIGLLAVNVTAVLADPPTFPSSFWGTVSDVPAGTSVAAWVNGNECAYTETVEDTGEIYYAVDVAPDDGANGCGNDGDTVLFYVDGKLSPQTGTFDEGTNVRLDLEYDPTVVTLSNFSAATVNHTSVVLMISTVLLLGLTFSVWYFKRKR